MAIALNYAEKVTVTLPSKLKNQLVALKNEQGLSTLCHFR